MTLPTASLHFFTSLRSSAEVADASSRFDEDDFALGCECADPALQIEGWGGEAAALPPRQAY